jgi:uncharacterized membrane protein YfcA
MTNPILYKSSCINGSIIAFLLAYAYYKNLLPKYIIGLILTVVITSILNHKTTNKIAKWCDRIFAFVSILALGYYIYTSKKSNRILMFFLLFLICSFYLIAKQKNIQIQRQNKAHFLAHVCATGLILLIVVNK